MNKFQAMVRALMLLDEDGSMAPGSCEYQTARKMITYKIDRLGPDAAFEQIKGNKAHLLAQVKMICS
jgi:hypothetical protein